MRFLEFSAFRGHEFRSNQAWAEWNLGPGQLPPAWAVGSADSGVVADQTTLILHWDGSNWSVVASPSPGTGGLNALYKVQATSASDVWAVGSFTNSGAFAQTLVERWTGQAWSVVSSPNVSGTNNELYDVVTLGTGNVWAVGYSGYEQYVTLIEHWNGGQWAIVPSPNPRPISQFSSILEALSATGSGDILTAGRTTNELNGADSALVEHWNGSAWSIVPSVNGGPAPSDLYGVAAAAPGDAWSVGVTFAYPLIERWNGSAWSVFTGPKPSGVLFSVAVISSCDVRAAGQTNATNVGNQTLSEHFTCN